MKKLYSLIALAFVAASVCVYAFIDKFGLGYWDKVEYWGATGDFFGGILNPIFAFLSLILLAYTLWQNRIALNNNSEELKLSRQELSNSVKAQELQVHQAKMQRFEDTFFSLLNQLKSTEESGLSDFAYDNIMVREYDKDWNNQSILRNSKEYIHPRAGNLNRYFRTLYQLLKFIANKCPESTLNGDFTSVSIESTTASETEKVYSNIVRSTLDSKLTVLLAVNCFCVNKEDSFYKYLLLIKRYSFLEHMPMSITGSEKDFVIPALVEYHDAQTFGNNTNII